MSYQLKVMRIEKVGLHAMPSTVKTHEPETLSDYDALASELCDTYAERKDIKIAGPDYVSHKDWDVEAVMDGYLYPGQYFMYSCPEHEYCWHVYDPMQKGELSKKYCVHSHVSYKKACQLIGQECLEEQDNREEK